MARGFPDYARSVGRSEEGELLPQQARPVIFFHDQFDNALFKWATSSGTITHEIHQASGSTGSYVRSGDACMKILSDSGSTGAAVLDIGLPPTTTYLGFEITFITSSWGTYSATTGGFLPFYIIFYDGSYLHEIGVSYNPDTGKWYVTDDGLVTWTLAGTREIGAGFHHTIKLILDLAGDEYKFLWIDGVKYSFSPVSIQKTADTTAVACAVWIQITGKSGSQADLYVDDVKFTYGES